jgi:hypothetical protein
MEVQLFELIMMSKEAAPVKTQLIPMPNQRAHSSLFCASTKTAVPKEGSRTSRINPYFLGTLATVVTRASSIPVQSAAEYGD